MAFASKIVLAINMKVMNLLRHAVISVLVSLIAFGVAAAADYPAPKEGDWVARDFRFHNGDVIPELHLHYTTVGVPTGEPVLVLHGTTQSGTAMLTPFFAGELFRAGPAARRKQVLYHSAG